MYTVSSLGPDRFLTVSKLHCVIRIVHSSLTFILLDVSRTNTARFLNSLFTLICGSVLTTSRGRFAPFTKSGDVSMTSQALRPLHRMLCRDGASVLCSDPGSPSELLWQNPIIYTIIKREE